MKKLLTSIATIAAAALFLAPAGMAFADTVVYNAIPSPQPGNVPSIAFEATSAKEFGGQIQLAGTDRLNPIVTVLMSSWGCQSGTWNGGTCVTTPGTTFSEPITLNIYNVNGDNTPGSLITSETQTFNIPFRPSADNVNCTGASAGEWFNGSSCSNGFATPITFNALTGVTLPNKVIVSVSYNTSDYGNAPYGDSTTCHASSGGCGYDSLNVGTYGSASVGSFPLPADAYQSSTWSGAYCDNGTGGTGTFRLDAGCWTGYQPAIEVQATSPGPTTNPATAISTTDATLNGTNGPSAAGQESFWVSPTSPIDTSSPNIPAGVYSTPVLPGIAAGATFSDPLSLVTTNGIITGGNPGNMPAITPNTTYYFVAWANIGGTWYPGGQLSVTTNPLTPSVTTNPATLVAPTSATVNGTNGPVAADNTSFWWGTTPIVGTLTPGGNVAEFPATNWSHDGGLGSASAGGTFNEALTGLTPGQTYYFVAWVEVSGTWYPGAVLSFTNPVPTYQVHIYKYLDGSQATPTSAHNASFPMFTTWTAQNSGSNVPFTLSPSGWTTGDIAYEASTEAMNSGANYTAWENTSTSLVGTTCDGSHTYALVGYSMGSSLAGAAAATQTATAPSFTNMTTDKYEIVWNKTCPVTPPAPPANACATPAVVPAGYTLKNGAVGNFTLTLSPFMMYVGKPGNNNISGPAGNYIICLAAGTNTINLGAGNDTILTSNGNQTIAVGAGNSTITTGNGNSKITAGTGTDTITVGNGNNTIVGGGGASVCHVGMGVNSITGCTH